MPIAVITFTFDPLVSLPGDLVVRWQTLALAAVVLVVLTGAGLLARSTDLRPDDLLSIAVGVVPGAVVAGRIGYVVAHPEAFSAGIVSLVDPAVPGLDLGLGVVGGILSGALVAALLGASVRAWAHLLAIPLLVALGAGKLALILGGTGQGLPFDGSWATAFLGPGPWGSLAPALPSHPSQAYEGIGTLFVAVLLAVAGMLGAFGARDGRLLLVAVAGWALVRAATSVTWRDPVAVGPFPVGGAMAVGIAIGAVGLLIVVSLAGRRSVRQVRAAAAADGDDPQWPDPEARPRF